MLVWLGSYVLRIVYPGLCRSIEAELDRVGNPEFRYSIKRCHYSVLLSPKSPAGRQQHAFWRVYASCIMGRELHIFPPAAKLQNYNLLPRLSGHDSLAGGTVPRSDTACVINS